MLLIILIATFSLLTTATFVLYQADNKAKLETATTAESIDKQLELQLIFGIAKGFTPLGDFPNFDLWSKSELSSGLCVRFQRPDKTVVKSACRGGAASEQWPRWFENIYRWSLQPGQEVIRQVTYNGKVHGTVTVSPSVETELSNTWRDVKKLMGLSLITILLLCSLLYFAVDWALNPARLIVMGLEKMALGNLSIRVPDFNITEWQRTGQAINHLVENQQKTLADRNQLALKLVNAQEQERRYLSRELHDEFGQSLAGLSAIASSMTQTAENECPKLAPEGKNISRITTHMMALLSDLLIRLRTTDFDTLGLSESLQGMVAEWNVRSGGKTKYNLLIAGDLENLPEPVPITLYRIVQECLTNVSRHSKAKNTMVKLKRSCYSKNTGRVNSDESITLTIEDDGIAEKIVCFNSTGAGLPGIRERVAALGGKLTLQTKKPSGLIIHVWLPLQTMPESQHE